MAAPTTAADVTALLRKSRLLSDSQLTAFLADRPNLASPGELLAALQTDGLLTRFQADQLAKGRHRGFVLGKYTLLDRIGMGGMGQVYLAEHTAMKRRVAVKVLPPDRGQNEFARERFLREARAAAALEHPHLVRAFDVDMDGDVAFLVMEYIDGVTLHDLVARRGPLAPARAAFYLWQVAAGLTAVHERALVHRDIKPANLLLDRAGVVRILDLGLVRSELDDDALTRGEGAKIVGTADYLAPEQAVSCSTVDSRADLYALGCTAYYLLTGGPPFPAEKVSQKLIAHQTQTPKPPHVERPGVPPGLSAVVARLMAKKPADRFQTAAEVMAALEPWAAEPMSPPSADDFPAAGAAAPPTNLATGRVSLGASFRLGAGSSASNTSGIRFTTDPASSSLAGLGQANQPTKASAEDTLPAPKSVPPVRPTPAAPPPAPAFTPIALTPAPARPPAGEPMTARVADLFGMSAGPAADATGVRGLWAAAAGLLALALAAGGYAAFALTR
jgi:serine/threonine protein kinase